MIATLCTDDDKPGTPTLVHVIPQGNAQAGVGSLAMYNNQLFVGRKAGARVEVYDTTTWSLQRHLLIAGLGTYIYGLAACVKNKCLYFSDLNGNCVHKVDLNSFNSVQWSVASGPCGLSLNRACNVLVACYEAKRLQEYASSG